MSAVLSSGGRRVLESGCVEARRVVEVGCRAVLDGLGVVADRRPEHLDEAAQVLRRGLRAKLRQLGGEFDVLVDECAYEQWHKLLFARFLAENNLLLHPEFQAPVTLADCEELAESVGESDRWGVAGRFAAEILPGIFRLDDPCVGLRLAPESRVGLARIVEELPVEVFTSSDGLGWVYQFWQSETKDEVNASERKIGGADLGPVTQLFTENYMVRFLLENSLGAWWAARHPGSPLVNGWEFLRFDDDGKPAAGSFDGWPEVAAEVTVMDPCCGSGHFLVEAFSMLWQMRAEEENLSAVEAQDAVLTDNLFGLELDPRCTQIAMFAVALAAWKAGGGWRQLPVPNIACSGIPVKTPVEEWKALAGGDPELENALVRLHILFQDADTLGSLIDPRRSAELTDPTGLQRSFDYVEWDHIAPLLTKALTKEANDPATAVLGATAEGTAKAADYLSRHYTLITTNVPFLQKASQSASLRSHAESVSSVAREDLATTMIERFRPAAVSTAMVSPMAWLSLGRYEGFRRAQLTHSTLHAMVRLGSRAFEGISGEVVMATLLVASATPPSQESLCWGLDVSTSPDANAKSMAIKLEAVTTVKQSDLSSNPMAILSLDDRVRSGSLLEVFGRSLGGTTTGDSPRYRRFFWELADIREGWVQQQLTPTASAYFTGRDSILDLAGLEAAVRRGEGVTIAGREAWGKIGVAARYTGDLPVTLYEGDYFENVIAVIVPILESDRPAMWHFCKSDEFSVAVRRLDPKIGVTANTLARVPFDVEHWRQVAQEAGPLPEPWSDDATQWLFEGRPEVACQPLQVGVGRLLGYRWPEQGEGDDLDGLADQDGVVCLPPVLGEPPAAQRLEQLLARAFGGTWTPNRTVELLEAAGSAKTDLSLWLRDEFFKDHCKVFGNRPFVWHIWDGRRDGFAALVNYHRLDRTNLERLTYTYLGDWIERQQAGVADETAGAEDRLAAAVDLQRRLGLLLDGEPPYDIYIRWKHLAEQPIGWDPDINDGVRFNVRPFVEAGVLRNRFNVHWKKDRGKNPDGSERHNDLHHTNTDKHNARNNPNP